MRVRGAAECNGRSQRNKRFEEKSNTPASSSHCSIFSSVYQRERLKSCGVFIEFVSGSIFYDVY
jgi:hypothetical protein